MLFFSFLFEEVFPSKKLSIILLSLLFSFLRAQVAPGVEWRKCTWSPGGLNGQLQQQSQSGEEWWYSHKNLYNASGTHTAFVTVGYTSLVSTAETYSNAVLFYNEGPDSPFNPINPVDYDYTKLQEGCSDRDYLGEHRTLPRGNIGLNALNGDMVFCKPKTIGALEEVVQDPQNADYVYVVGTHLGVKPYKNKTNFISYNPTTSYPSDYFSLSNLGVSNYTNSIDHFYVAKIKIDGTVIWQGLYGYADFINGPLTAYECKSYGYDIIFASNGNLVATGLSKLDGNLKGPSYPFLIEIDPNTGYLIKKSVLPISGYGIYSASGVLTRPSFGGECHSIVEIGNSGKYAVATTYFFKDTSVGEKDDNNAFVWSVDQNLNISSLWPNNPIRFASNSSTNYNSNIWEVKYHKALKQLLIPVVQNCIKCGTASGNAGEGYIYRLDSLGSMISQGTNPSLMGPVNAFDLRIGVEETMDGGFAAVSSVRPPDTDHSPPTADELGYLANCGFLNFNDWDTDALVVKYASDGSKTWSKVFDVGDNRSRQAPPGDLKRQECMYKITQTPDGGYVISGNASSNFDDNYMAKLYSDCNAQQTYTYGPGYVININSNTIWTSSQNILGKIVVHAGARLTISGANTVIRFADSKLSGIETNITLMPGSAFDVTDGAILTSIDTLVCKSSSWDGVVRVPDLAAEGELLVYPSPASNSFNLVYNGEDGTTSTYFISDMLGNILQSGTLLSDATLNISSNTYAAGVYFVSLYKGKKLIKSRKFLIMKG